jgi:hypothetical protein
MKIEFGEIPNGFLSTVSYTKQKTSWIENEEGVEVGDKVRISGVDFIFVKVLNFDKDSQRISPFQLRFQF